MKIAIIRFFPDFSGKTGQGIRIFLDRKSPHAKDEANKKKFSQIGPGVPEEIGRKHTYKQTNIVLLYKRDMLYSEQKVNLF